VQGPLAGPAKPPELITFTTAQTVGDAMKVGPRTLTSAALRGILLQGFLAMCYHNCNPLEPKLSPCTRAPHC
jgi:hypothetical protein